MNHGDDPDRREAATIGPQQQFPVPAFCPMAHVSVRNRTPRGAGRRRSRTYSPGFLEFTRSLALATGMQSDTAELIAGPLLLKHVIEERNMMNKLWIATATLALAALPALASEATFDRNLSVSGRVELSVSTGSGNIHLTPRLRQPGSNPWHSQVELGRKRRKGAGNRR